MTGNHHIYFRKEYGFSSNVSYISVAAIRSEKKLLNMLEMEADYFGIRYL